MEPIEELKIMIAKYILVEGEECTIGKMAFFFSLKQNWFTMGNSKILLQDAIDIGLLEEKEGDALRPTFSIDEMEVPSIFTPSENLPEKIKKKSSSVQAMEEDPLMKIVSRIRDVTGGDIKSAIKEINQKQKETGFTIEVAALLVARYHKAQVDDLFPGVRNSLQSTK